MSYIPASRMPHATTHETAEVEQKPKPVAAEMRPKLDLLRSMAIGGIAAGALGGLLWAARR